MTGLPPFARRPASLSRRGFLVTALAESGLAAVLPVQALAAPESRRLEMPPLLDTSRTGRLQLAAQPGTTNFLGLRATATAGFGQAYLGPTIRVRNGPLAASVSNALAEAVSVHWHGLLVPGVHDGGPHSPILPGRSWTPNMQIAQQPATLWYHSHMHGRTASHVYWGLAGMLQVTDGRDDDRGLPSAYGLDDLPLIVQDRRFDDAGRMVYAPTMTDVLNGFQGDRMLVNGQSGRVAVVPRGIVRLRLLNASNARIYTLTFDDGRPMHLVATDGGLLAAPAAMAFLRLAPGERAEVLVDFGDGRAAALRNSRGLAATILHFETDAALPVRVQRLPDRLDEVAPSPAAREARTRRFSLTMGGGSASAMSHHGAMGMTGHQVRDFCINGRPFDMHRIDTRAALGEVERWVITGGGGVDHPFHVHGTQFRVLGEGGGAAPSPMNSGWKDVVLITGETEILVRFDHPADDAHPFMYHCHNLEHEDAGMMGQLVVT